MFQVLSENMNKPQLQMVIEPANKVRFRYPSERGSHGPIVGITSSKKKKCFPTVMLLNYNGEKDVIVRVSLYTKEREKHVLELKDANKGKKCWRGMIYEDLDRNCRAEFSSLVIQNKKKEEVFQILMDQKLAESSVTGSAKKQLEKKYETEIKQKAKEILNSARLCFEAFLKSNPSAPICPKLFSEPIYNQKATVCSDLKIYRMSLAAGSWRGGDEVILLCDKVQKENIKIVFYETDAGGDVIWEGEARFSPNDVHFQYAITFKTPPYHENIEKFVSVCLRRKDDSSDPVQFRYIPDETRCLDIVRKRRRMSTDYHEKPTAMETFQNKNSMVSPSTSSSDISQLNCLEEIPDCEVDNKNDNELNIIFNEDMDEFVNYFLDDHMEDILNSIGDPEFGQLPPLPLETELGQLPEDLVTDSAVPLVQNQSINLDYDFSNLSLSSSSSSQREEENLFSMQQKIEGKDKHLCTHKQQLNKQLEIGNSTAFEKYSAFSKLLCMKDKYGNNLLHLAINFNNKNIEKILKMNKMASFDIINKQNEFKQTPLQLAVKHYNPELVKLLLLYGGKPNIRNGEGNNCFHVAAKWNSISCLKILCKPEFSTNIDVFNYEGLTPLHLAVINNSTDCVQAFLKHVSNINSKEHKSGKSPLHFAIEMQAPSVKHLLNDERIDINIQDFEGNTPLHLACANGYLDMVKLLLNAGADPSTENFHKSCLESDPEIHGEKPGDLVNEDDEESSLILELLRKSLSEDTRESSESDYSDCYTDVPYLLDAVVEELCKILDPPNTNWQIFGMYAGLDEEHLNRISSNLISPTKAILSYLQKENQNNFMEIMQNAFEMAGLENASQIVKDI